MRIGQVVKAYKISVDSLYYYIKYGLLVPPRPGGQYDFDAQTIRDLELVQELKGYGFSLKSIHRILSLYRISGLENKEDSEELIALYQEKMQDCSQEIQNKQRIMDALASRIVDLQKQRNKSGEPRGIPLRMLDLLCCPDCGGDLAIASAQMNSKFIFSGKLTCSCGYHSEIEEGILLTPNKNWSLYDKPDIGRELYKDLPPLLLSHFQRSYNLMLEAIKKMDLRDKVIVEPYINAWFFLHNHFEHFDPKGKYIVIDKYPETLRMYKNLMEQSGCKLDILYIADSSSHPPLRPGCIDLHLDFFALNEHQFYAHSFWPTVFKPYLAKSATLLGTYFCFKNGARSMSLLHEQYPESDRYNFNLTFFLEEMKKTGIELSLLKEVGSVHHTGDNLGFGFHADGDEMKLVVYQGHFHPSA